MFTHEKSRNNYTSYRLQSVNIILGIPAQICSSESTILKRAVTFPGAIYLPLFVRRKCQNCLSVGLGQVQLVDQFEEHLVQFFLGRHRQGGRHCLKRERTRVLHNAIRDFRWLVILYVEET